MFEMDSHADSPVVGKQEYIFEYTGRTVSGSGFTNTIGKPMLVDVVNALVAYDCDQSGKSYLLLINNALLVPSVNGCLINPFLMRLAGLHVNECRKFLAPSPTDSDHSIYFPSEGLGIPLELAGIISCIACRSPTFEESLDLDSFLSITPRSDTWDPHAPIYSS